MAEALATGVELTVVARSAQGGRPDLVPAAFTERRTPEQHPLEAVKAVEVLVGGKRDTMVFVGGQGRVVTPQAAGTSAAPLATTPISATP